MSRTVVSWIDHHAQRIPDRVALVDLHRRRETSYRELAARVRSLAWSLQNRYGVGPGSRVAVLAELLVWCRGRLAGYKVPARVVVVDELPRNATGKVLKGPLRASIEAAEQDRSHA